MFYVKDPTIKLIVVIHVDDMVIAGNIETVNIFKKELKQHYNITDLGELKQHLGVKYEWFEEENKKI